MPGIPAIEAEWLIWRLCRRVFLRPADFFGALIEPEGAQRELKEETGLTADRWHPILDVHLSNSITDEAGIIYVAEGLTHGEPEFEDTEQIQIRKLPFDDVVQMVNNGEITDLLSVAGILKLAAMRQGQQGL